MARPATNDRNAPKAGRRDAAPPFWEWVVASAGLLLLLASFGYLLVDALTTRGGQAVPRIEVLDIAPQGPRFLVRLKVHNDGETTAAALRVAGELKRGETPLESSEAVFDYLPPRSSKEAVLAFQQDPRTLQLVLAPRSWQAP